MNKKASKTTAIGVGLGIVMWICILAYAYGGKLMKFLKKEVETKGTPNQKEKIKETETVKVQKLTGSLKRVSNAEDNKRIKLTERKWVEDTPKINDFNFWYYRYFTNELELYILKKQEEK